MSNIDYDRYELVRNSSNTIDQLPFVSIPINPTDKYEEWIDGRSRMDKLSQRYYTNPLYDWIIMYANPEYISEFDIPDGTIIRIPFPLEKAKQDYENEIKKIKTA